MSTPQNQAINVANNIIGLAAQLKAVYDAYKVVSAQWTDVAVANTLNAQATALANTDGSLGAADGTPNVAHPIATVGLSRALSANQVTSMKTVLDGFVTYVEGGAVSANPGARAILSSAAG
jgi:hypothetical protein